MNCQDFEASINDLARNQIMDSERRAGALAHSEGCRECAARLADERMLSAGLSRLAASGDEAPARVEARLLAHFREREVIQTGRTATTIRPRWMAREYPRRSRWAIAAAAAVLILIALVALRANQSAPEPVQKAADTRPDNTQPDNTQPAPIAVQSLPEQKSSVTPVNRKRNRQNHYAADRHRRAAPDTEANKASEADYEIATDFIPLIGRGNLAQLEGGQVVRVEMPRSALVSFGLPVDLERAGERIKADVVVGNDGMARAIRFVR